MAQYRYKSEMLPSGTTHRALQWLGQEKQISAIVAWVEENLEPQVPEHIIVNDDDIVDLQDILAFEFEDVVPSVVIKRAISSLDTWNWVMKGHPKMGGFSHETKSSAPAFRLGSAEERKARAELLSRLDQLDEAIRRYRVATGNTGHNQQTGTIELDESTPPSVFPLEQASFELRTELCRELPSLETARHASKRIRVWAKAWEWFREKADRAVNSVVDKAGEILMIAIAASGMLSCGDHAAQCAHDVHVAAEEWFATAELENEPPHSATEAVNALTGISGAEKLDN